MTRFVDSWIALLALCAVRKAWTLLVLAATSPGLITLAYADAPVLDRLSPPGGQRGAKVVVTCEGKFGWPVKVATSGVDATVLPEAGKLEIAIPVDLPADRVWLRLYNEDGASALVPFLIGSLSEAQEEEPNNAWVKVEKPQHLPVTLNGLVKRGDVDCFRVELSQGETLVAAFVANHHLGTSIDGVMQIVSSDGFVVAENHDDVRFDPLVVYQPPKSGSYYVRVLAFGEKPRADVNLKGDDACLYRLTLTTGPFVMNALPSAISNLTDATVQVFGWNLPADARLAVVPYGGSPSRLLDHQEFEALAPMRVPSDARLGIAFAPNMAGSVRVRVVPHADSIPAPPATSEQPMSLAVPTSLTGCLTTPRQRDVYTCMLSKGSQVIISVESSRIDSLLDPQVTLLDPSGSMVPEAASLINPQRDAVFTYAVPADGKYTLAIADPYQLSSPRRYYRLSVRQEEPDFELTVQSDAIVVAPGKETEIPVQVVRRAAPGASDGVGAITIEALGLPDGTTLAPATSEPAGDTSTAVTLKVSSQGPPFSGYFQIVGHATIPRTLDRPARTPEKFGACFESIWLTVTK